MNPTRRSVLKKSGIVSIAGLGMVGNSSAEQSLDDVHPYDKDEIEKNRYRNKEYYQKVVEGPPSIRKRLQATV